MCRGSASAEIICHGSWGASGALSQSNPGACCHVAVIRQAFGGVQQRMPRELHPAQAAAASREALGSARASLNPVGAAGSCGRSCCGQSRSLKGFLTAGDGAHGGHGLLGCRSESGCRVLPGSSIMEQGAQATVQVASPCSNQGLSTPGSGSRGPESWTPASPGSTVSCSAGPSGTCSKGTPCETSTKIMNVSSSHPRMGLGRRNVSEKGSSLRRNRWQQSPRVEAPWGICGLWLWVLGAG